VGDRPRVKQKKRKRWVSEIVVIIYLFIYLFCPCGTLPAGFTLVVSCCCVNPPPVHVGCWPPGELPPPFVQPVSVV